jgi:hypothetical protein
MTSSTIEEWPICEVEGCEEEVDPRRVAIIGVPRCLRHGEAPRTFTVAPAFNKGGYQLITPSNVKDIGKAK